MAYASKKIDDTIAPRIIKKSLTQLGAALSFVGKPLYLLLSYTIVIVLSVAYITGYITRTAFQRITHFPSIILSILKSTKPLEKKLQTLNKQLKVLILKILHKLISFLGNAARSILHLQLKFLFITFQLFKKTTTLISRTFKFILRKAKSLKPVFRLPKIRVSKPKIAFTLTLTTLIIGAALISTFWFLILKDLPSPEELITRQIDISTKIYDRNGHLLYNIYKDRNRTLVKLDQIPKHVQLATIAIEDAEFYLHPGFSVRGISRAIIRNIKRGELTGGSTITQQLVKNALLSSEKTLIRKLREIVLAIRVELAFSKDEILEMYLNEVAYGGTAYGIQEASRAYFGKDADRLTLAEAALLAGLPKSPTRFSPFGPNPQAPLARQKKVLHLMQVNGFITKDQKVSAENEEITFAQNITDIKAPHFVMFVRQALVEKYGEEVVAKGGLQVYTTLDLKIQRLAEEVVKSEVEKLKDLNVGNGAALVLDTQTAEILAMVGSKDYFDIESDGNVNLTTALRQPGSSIKVVNYSYALSNGYTAATILEDTPVTFQVKGQPPYSPRNYDNRFRGRLPLRNALAESRNVPAVKVLASYGVDKMIEQGKKMGITTWKDQSNYGLSLTLGGGEVKLIDLAQVYVTVADYGMQAEITSILKVINYQGKVLEESRCTKEKIAPPVAKEVFNIEVQATESAAIIEAKKSTCDGEQVLDPRVAYLLIDILKDNRARSPAFGSSSLLVIPEHSEVVVKTGTSNDLRDNLAIGFNQNYLVASWVGNNDNSPMSRIASGITGATPIFHKIMSALLVKEENSDWIVPKGLVQVPICPITGTLPCKGCPIRIEWFLEENQPTKSCSPEFFEKLKDKEKGQEDKDKEKEKFRFYLPADRQGEIFPEAARTEREERD